MLWIGSRDLWLRKETNDGTSLKMIVNFQLHKSRGISRAAEWQFLRQVGLRYLELTRLFQFLLCTRRTYLFFEQIQTDSYIWPIPVGGSTVQSFCLHFINFPSWSQFSLASSFHLISAHVLHWRDRFESASLTQYTSHMHVSVGVGVLEWKPGD